jgi:shikimate 5-dehydrogenase
MKLVVTVLEETCEAAVRAIRAIALPHDMVEVRAEKFPSMDAAALQAATTKPMILTFRNAPRRDVPEWRGLIDVEWHEGITIDDPSRTVISHHDYDGVTNVESIMTNMRALNCAHTKLAATPKTFAENERLLRLLPSTVNRQPSTIIGMGERGLYSRILAPFRGSELTFVATSNIAAPGMITHERALQIYGVERADRVFAILGNPAGHSLSPVIHNRLFREKRVPAAYTIASFETFDEIKDAFLRGEPCGLSVTTPFKEDAFRFASDPASNAKRARAVNTLVNVNGTVLADNTDVDGFAALLPKANKAAVLGRGPTARAALVALEDANISATMYTRETMHTLQAFDGDLIINTMPPEADVAIPPCRVYFEAAYSGAPKPVEAEQRITGLDLLHAQAVRQHELFMKVFNGL